MKKRDLQNSFERLTIETILIHVKVWFMLSFWPIALLAAACYFGMPTKLGLALGGIVLTLTTGGVLINFICYIGKIDIPKIL